MDDGGKPLGRDIPGGDLIGFGTGKSDGSRRNKGDLRFTLVNLMPAIYQTEDSGEPARKRMDASLAAAVTFDDGKTGTLTQVEYQALSDGDEIKPPQHPPERSSLSNR